MIEADFDYMAGAVKLAEAFGSVNITTGPADKYGFIVAETSRALQQIRANYTGEDAPVITDAAVMVRVNELASTITGYAPPAA